MLIMSRFFEEGWQYLDKESESWKLKPNVPEWARREFKRFYSALNSHKDFDQAIKSYVEKFGESFPFFFLRDLTEEESVKLIAGCVAEGKPYEPAYEEGVEY